MDDSELVAQSKETMEIKEASAENGDNLARCNTTAYNSNVVTFGFTLKKNDAQSSSRRTSSLNPLNFLTNP